MNARTLAFVLAAAAGCGTEGPPIGPYENPSTALLVLDLQRDFLEPGGRLPVAADQVEPMLGAVRATETGARAAGAAVVQIENGFAPDDAANPFRNQAAVRGTAGAEWDPRIPLDADARFTKASADAFSVAELDAWLRERRVSHVVLPGVYADGCVLSTSLGARNRRYRVSVVAPAVAAATGEARRAALESMRSHGVEVVERPEQVDWSP